MVSGAHTPAEAGRVKEQAPAADLLLLFVLQRDFTVRIQSKSALTTSDVRATNGEVMSVTPVAGTTGSYDVAVASKSKTGTVAVSTIASAAVAASTIIVDVDTSVPQVTIQPHHVCLLQPLVFLLCSVLFFFLFFYIRKCSKLCAPWNTGLYLLESIACFENSFNTS